MALATTDDVRRHLPDHVDDSALEKFLEAAEEWVERTCGRDWDAVGEVTEHFYDVRDGDIITLRDENPTGVSVVIGDSTLVEDSDYTVREVGKIGLIFTRYAAAPGLPGATVEVRPWTFNEITVTYTASDVVPSPVREAVAMITAATYLDSKSAGALLSEKLGDYSYHRTPEGDRVAVPTRASALLRPYSKRLRARST